MNQRNLLLLVLASTLVLCASVAAIYVNAFRVGMH